MRDRPHPQHKLEWPGGVVPEWARPQKGKRAGRGRGGKARGRDAGKRERLQKVMAQSGYGSRRNLEILIAQGHVTVNGQVARLGDSAGPGDKVKLDGRLIQLRFGIDRPRVLLYHKPEGEIVTRDDPEKRATVFDRLPRVHGGRWVSVGRLDLNTGGLLLFTTNGEVANRLTHPRFEVEREYAVRVMGELTDEAREKLLKTGVDIDGELCTFDSVEDRGGEGANHWYHVVLREGKNREVRRMMEAVGLMVSRLMRVRFGPVALPGFLKRGMMREMDEDQVADLMAFVGPSEAPAAEAEDEEDEHDNVGNRIDAGGRGTVEEDFPDDNFGNRIEQEAPVREADGNRGTYDPNASADVPKAGKQGRRGGQGGNKAFGFKKRGQGQGQGHGHGQGQGNRAKGKPRDPGAPPRQHAQGQGQGQGQGQPQPQGHAQAHGQGPGQGQGKPGRHRNRHRNRNRNRGAREGGERQPETNANREPS